MVGQAHSIGSRIYVEVNEHGTLCKLLPMGFWHTLWLCISTAIKPMSDVEVRRLIEAERRRGEEK